MKQSENNKLQSLILPAFLYTIMESITENLSCTGITFDINNLPQLHKILDFICHILSGTDVVNDILLCGLYNLGFKTD